jgi:YfiH family protein
MRVSFQLWPSGSKTLYNEGLFELNQEKYYEVSEWAKFDWLRHGFGTRDARYPEERLATVKQVHGNEVRRVSQAGQQVTGDGLISDTPGLLVGIRTADCMPIFLIDPVHRVVSAVHAGWRGTATGIGARAIELMREEFGSDPAQMEAAIGPGIGRCCFEVGPEVAREFGPWASEAKTCLDLSRINRLQLESAGVVKVYESGLCTMCGTGFYSFRRERDQAGRMLSFVGRRS